jgi:general secretion pathway protein G
VAILNVIKAALLFGVVALLTIMFLGAPSTSAKPQRVDQDFTAIDRALKAYASHAGQPPSMAQGLEALVNEPRTSPKPKAWVQVMKGVPEDPWGTPYRYLPLGPKEREWRWELRCAGPDRVFGNRDDLTGETECGDYLTLQDGSADSRPSY